MIKYFAIENYRSIKKECVIDFDLNIPKNNPFPANTVIGFAGANASGKTTVLQALAFVLWFMENSFLKLEGTEEIPYNSFIGLENNPTKFHLIFSKKTTLSKEQEERFVDYEYLIYLTKEKVIYEEVNYYPVGRKRNIYIRDLLKVKFGRQIKVFGTEDLRNNCSLISLAKQFKSQLIALKFANYLHQRNINYNGLQDEKFVLIEELLSDNNNLLSYFTKVADIGIDSVFMNEEHKIEGNLQEILKMLESINSRTSKKEIKVSQEVINEIKKLDDSKGKIRLDFKLLLFKHKIANSYVDFPQEQESSGTLQFLMILQKILVALNTGTLLILDEIEIKLHQNLVAYLIGLFQNPSFNTNGAQLIFSFHNSYLMNILEPHQLWFTQKNDDGETEVFSANDFKDISKFGREHLEELYRIGRFGAIPRGI